MQRLDRRVFLGAVILGAAFDTGRGKITPGTCDVLIIIDVQNCLVPGACSPSETATRSSR